MLSIHTTLAENATFQFLSFPALFRVPAGGGRAPASRFNIHRRSPTKQTEEEEPDEEEEERYGCSYFEGEKCITI